MVPEYPASAVGGSLAKCVSSGTAKPRMVASIEIRVWVGEHGLRKMWIQMCAAPHSALVALEGGILSVDRLFLCLLSCNSSFTFSLFESVIAALWSRRHPRF